MEINKGEISIIVPIYNVEKYLRKCLDSLLSQTYQDIKIWAVNDGSLDNSLSIIKEYENISDKIICVDKQNGGYGSVLEYAIKTMKSEYFIICDPDDWLEPNAIEYLYKEASSNNLDIVVSDRYDIYFDSSEDKKHYVDVSIDNGLIESNVIYCNKECAKLSLCSVTPHSKLYRTSICKDIIFEHKASYTDTTLFVVALNNAKRVKKIDIPLSYYLCDRPGNTATDANSKKFDYLIRVWNSTYTQIKEDNNPFLILKMYYFARHIYSQFKRFHDKKEVKKYANNINMMFKEVKTKEHLLLHEAGLNKKKRFALRLYLNCYTRPLIAFVKSKNKG